MKYLTILRHAKAKRPENFPTDLERPLTKRGQRDATALGETLRQLDPGVDWIISSPALRTRQTTTSLVDAIAFKREVVWHERVYEALPDSLLDVLALAPAERRHILLVGHNPGLAELISGLAAGAPTRLALDFPPGGLAHLSLELFSWNQIRWGCATLHCLLRPEFMGEADD
jgi:phosphohistidine phosphatase